MRKARACMKIHSRHLHASLRGIFGPNSLTVAHYAALIRAKSSTKCDAYLTESNSDTFWRSIRQRECGMKHRNRPGQGMQMFCPGFFTAGLRRRLQGIMEIGQKGA